MLRNYKNQMKLADKIIKYYTELDFKGDLPKGISIMNPFAESDQIRDIVVKFYSKYYNDLNKRILIFGINPGRLGAGSTGIPFTDTKRLIEFCGISVNSLQTHEPSSVFIYDVINAFGGPEIFYKKFYINSLCPLGFTIHNSKTGKDINYNYYDSKDLEAASYDFIVWNVKTQIEFGCFTDKCYCLGTGKNYAFFQKLNSKYQFFDKIIPLDHPRFIMQYKLNNKQLYIDKYTKQLSD